MSIITVENRPLTGLIHPMVGPAWTSASRSDVPVAERRELGARFITSGFEPGAIIEMVSFATRETGLRRELHERENMARLGLSEMVVREFEKNGHDRRTRTAAFLQRFGIWSQLAKPEDYGELDGQNKDYSYGTELFGVFQHGNWDATKGIDNAIRRLERQIEDEFPSAHIETYQDKDRSRLGYVFEPFTNLKIGESNPYMKHGFGTVRRRRAAADIDFDNLYITVGAFKESTALVGIGLMSNEEKDVFGERANIAKKVYTEGREPTAEEDVVIAQANQIAGEHFEIGIEEQRGQTKVIIPISSHYVGRVVIPRALK